MAQTDGRVSAEEAASGGVTWTFAPMTDVSRDPRWGRVAEGFGEDTLLNAVFGAAKVRGYQGDSLADPGAILACAKHYVGYGAAEGGRDCNTVDISEYRLRNVHLEPFRAGVGSPRPHRGRCRRGAQPPRHGVAADLHDALVQSLGAGLDVEMGGNVVGPGGRTTLAPDDLPVERVDDAVRRVLRLKFALGLFDDPYVDPAAEITAPIHAARDAARTAAERSAVLLKNDGTLPLAEGPLQVLLVGPYADSTDHLGAWVQSFAESAGSLAEALRAERPDVEFTVLPGASFFGVDAALQQAAARAAADSDVVLVAVGEPSALAGEASSRSDLRLPGDQENLIHAIAATGTPSAVVLVNGRAARGRRLDRPGADGAGGVAPRHRGRAGDRPPAHRGGQSGRPPAHVVPPVGGAGPDPLRRREHGAPGQQRRRPAAGRDRHRPAGAGQRRRPVHLQVPRPAAGPAVPLRPRAQLHDLRVRPPVRVEDRDVPRRTARRRDRRGRCG